MARFSGIIGYGEDVRIGPGVTEEVITERRARGDFLRNSRQMIESSTQVLPQLNVNNSISVVADEYARGHYFAIRYVIREGVYWSVTDVTVEHPRLVLQLGGVYNGPKGKTPGDSGGDTRKH